MKVYFTELKRFFDLEYVEKHREEFENQLVIIFDTDFTELERLELNDLL